MGGDPIYLFFIVIAAIEITQYNSNRLRTAEAFT